MPSPNIPADYEARLTEVAEKETAYQAALGQLYDQGVQLDEWEILFASLPPEVIRVHDYILCSFPDHDEDYIQERLTTLAKGYGVEDTMHKLALVEQATVASIELDQARTLLDNLWWRLSAKQRQKLKQQEAGQGVLI